jgi:hypothetical protein
VAFYKYFNPLYPFLRVKKDVSQSFRGVRETLAETKRRLREEQEKAIEMANLSGTPKERFERAVKEGGWSESDLKDQMQGARRARRIFLVFSYVTVPLSVGLTLFMPWWLALFLLPATLVFFILMTTVSAKHAWWEWQISQRSFESFKSFASAPDFIKRVLIP